MQGVRPFWRVGGSTVAELSFLLSALCRQSDKIKRELFRTSEPLWHVHQSQCTAGYLSVRFGFYGRKTRCSGDQTSGRRYVPAYQNTPAVDFIFVSLVITVLEYRPFNRPLRIYHTTKDYEWLEKRFQNVDASPSPSLASTVAVSSELLLSSCISLYRVYWLCSSNSFISFSYHFPFCFCDC